MKLSRADVLGRVFLIPGYLNGNSVNTIPRSFRGKFPKEATADSRPNSGTGSLLFEFNMWIWRYGRTLPRQISVEQAVKYLWSKLNPGHVVLRLFGARVIEPWQRELLLCSE